MFPGHITITKSHARLRPETLKGAQAALWATLPPSYRDLLCRWNGGFIDEGQLCFDTPIPYVKDGRQVRDHQTDSVVEFFGFQPPGGTCDPHDLATVKVEHDAEEFLPLGVIAIAECPGNSLLCLSTRREDHGVVYYWDYYWKYPWSRPFFEPRIQAAKQAFPDLDAIRADPLHPRRREAVDMLNYATLVRLADDLGSWLSMCRPDDRELRPADSHEKTPQGDEARSTTSAIVKAKRLIQDLLDQFPDSPLNARDMEPGLSGVLELIQDNPLEREQFAHVFIAMLQGKQKSPEWLIAYCMRTLRWAEIKQAAEAVRASGEANKLSLAWEVLDAYEDENDWIGIHYFERYLHQPR